MALRFTMNRVGKKKLGIGIIVNNLWIGFYFLFLPRKTYLPLLSCVFDLLMNFEELFLAKEVDPDFKKSKKSINEL